VGWVGYWERTWRDHEVYEIGWSVLPAFQGRGIAGLATAQAIAQAAGDGKHRFLHASPPSTTLVEECDLEYPPGTLMRCNDWRLDLDAKQPERRRPDRTG
jgi:hypothetical protein